MQKNSLKNFLYFGKWNFLTPRLKISFLGGTSKVPKTKIYTSLNLSEEIHRIKCQYNHDEKENVKIAKLNISIMTVFSNMQTLKRI